MTLNQIKISTSSQPGSHYKPVEKRHNFDYASRGRSTLD